MGRASSVTGNLQNLVAGTVTPILDQPGHPRRPGRRGNNKRKETLLSLLDALSELTKEDDEELVDAAVAGRRSTQQRSFEDDHDVPTVDEQHQVAGGETFNKFAKRITNLDNELRNFSNAARQLGSSVAILSSAFHLRERLAQILFLFRENAADLFPRKVARQPAAPPTSYTSKKRRKTRKPPPHVARPTAGRDLDAEDFPEQIEGLASDVITFLNCLNEFPEFTDEAVNASIKSFEGDLKYWAACLKEYTNQFKYPAVQRYLHDLTSEMGEHLDSISSTLNYFTDVGVPTIRFAQKHGAQNLQNLSTVATFFSAVTATTLQFSFNLTSSALQNAVNAFWFASLVFSIASAVNSLLGVTWKQAMYRSPGHRVPWWVLIWIKRSPLVFLVISVACFSIGLVLFAYASDQSHTTSTITTVFTAFSSFGLMAVSTWFASERWAFTRHKGKKWLADVLDDVSDRFAAASGLAYLSEKTPAALRRSTAPMRTIARRLAAGGGHGRGGSQTSESTLPVVGGTGAGGVGDGDPHSPRPSDGQRGGDFFGTKASSTEGSVAGLLAHSGALTTSPTTEKTPASASASKPPVAMPRERGRFAQAVHNMMLMQRTVGIGSLAPDSPARRRTHSGGVLSGSSAGPASAVRSNRLAALTPRLQCLETTQDLAAHSALVRHLMFSPDGKYLATCSWDRTCVMFRVGAPQAPLIAHRVLAHPQGFVHQVAWSPNGNSLLTRMTRGIKIWTDDGVCRKTIDRKRNVQSITWFPGGEAFMSVEKTEAGSDIVKVDLNGKVLDVHSFTQMEVHDVAVTPDCKRLLGVGTLLRTAEGLVPSKSRAEKRIIAYNLENRTVESQVPVLNDVRDITLARNAQMALVSYENKAPPQLWKLDMIKQHHDEHIHDVTARFTLRHTYMPKVPVDFAGPSYFGGKNDELVLCAAKAGDIHIWDRESGSLLHHVRTASLGGDLTCIAWNHASDDPFMFATGSHDGGVRIWTKPLPRLVFDDRDEMQSAHGGGGGQTSGPQTPRSRSPSVTHAAAVDGGYGYPAMVESPAGHEYFGMATGGGSDPSNPASRRTSLEGVRGAPSSLDSGHMQPPPSSSSGPSPRPSAEQLRLALSAQAHAQGRNVEAPAPPQASQRPRARSVAFSNAAAHPNTGSGPSS
ncbi:hypothetical protein PUNSTDRAFT_88042 [Punctularia strigosozonata HHB-11173 SS5]|uniref:uncharacterized protein n=1 Tax=Punctularia strigosozonata (strain HHB-11173) TaxID=741275 RepID=UPI00044168C2|nr:uncharacterized protein PUNSTDRAFT_88042 [Punctularia strigosozonata HHB-11173 SS5]EIN08602.1 hypothetical protein PUNSTDRAFT_88042 [Punctularia strigosozonata HHB-11173 SS5]